MRVAGIDHDNNSSEYSGKQGERDVSRGNENSLLWSMLYRWMHWDRQIFWVMLVEKATYVVMSMRIQKFSI